MKPAMPGKPAGFGPIADNCQSAAFWLHDIPAPSKIVDPPAPGFFQCVSRCMRRAFLCGQDAYSGRSYEHRKAWVEERLLELAECFAIGLYAYAITSNHVHVVLQVDPQVARQWSATKSRHAGCGCFQSYGGRDQRRCMSKKGPANPGRS
jgi:hypothetical protein